MVFTEHSEKYLNTGRLYFGINEIIALRAG